MRIKKYASPLSWATLALLSLLNGCTSGKKTTAETAPSSPTLAAEGDGACLPPEPAEESDVLAPVKVTVEPGPFVDLKTGEADLVIRVYAKTALPYALSLQVMPPAPQATPTAAKTEPAPTHTENLRFSCRSTLTRTVRVHAGCALTPETAARVVVQGQSPDGSVGVTVRKQFPPAPELTAPPSQGVPPGGRPPTLKPR